jgi:hypothetical protein
LLLASGGLLLAGRQKFLTIEFFNKVCQFFPQIFQCHFVDFKSNLSRQLPNFKIFVRHAFKFASGFQQLASCPLPDNSTISISKIISNNLPFSQAASCQRPAASS